MNNLPMTRRGYAIVQDELQRRVEIERPRLIGAQQVWQLVGEPEADAHNGRISVTSPIGRALLGKRKGETINVQAPGGIKSYEVATIEWRDVGSAPRKT